MFKEWIERRKVGRKIQSIEKLKKERERLSNEQKGEEKCLRGTKK